MVARRRRENMVKLKITKPYQKSCHLFEFFVLKTKQYSEMLFYVKI